MWLECWRAQAWARCHLGGDESRALSVEGVVWVKTGRKRVPSKRSWELRTNPWKPLSLEIQKGELQPGLGGCLQAAVSKLSTREPRRELDTGRADGQEPGRRAGGC